MSNILQDLLTLSYIPRWSTVAMQRTQTVSDHTFRVMAICLDIMNNLVEIVRVPVSAGVRAQVLEYALVHDGPEAYAGDIPHPFRTHIEDKVQELEREKCPWFSWYDDHFRPDVTCIVRVADAMEAMTWAIAVADRNTDGTISDRIKSVANGYNKALDAADMILRGVNAAAGITLSNVCRRMGIEIGALCRVLEA